MSNSRKLSRGEIEDLRNGTSSELAGYVPPPAVELDEVDYSKMPAKGPDDLDLLSPMIVQRICEHMAANHTSLAVAARVHGLPTRVVEKYLDKGNEELCKGVLTRMGWFAVLVNRAEGKVQTSYVIGMKLNPLGWMNLSWLSEHMWPNDFAIQRIAAKHEKTSVLAEQLARLLNDARDGQGGGAPLPFIDVQEIGKDDA